MHGYNNILVYHDYLETISIYLKEDICKAAKSVLWNDYNYGAVILVKYM